MNKSVDYKAVNRSSGNLPCNLFAKFNYSKRMESQCFDNIELN